MLLNFAIKVWMLLNVITIPHSKIVTLGLGLGFAAM